MTVLSGGGFGYYKSGWEISERRRRGWQQLGLDQCETAQTDRRNEILTGLDAKGQAFELTFDFSRGHRRTMVGWSLAS
jgi:hypothetical protein